MIPDRIQFACPCCHDQVRLKGKWAGRKILCPRCVEPIRVPGLASEDWRQDDPRADRSVPFFDPLPTANGPGLVKTASEIRSVSLDELDPEPNHPTAPPGSDRYAPSLEALSEEFLPGDELIEAALVNATAEAGDELTLESPPPHETHAAELFGVSGEEFRLEDEAAGGLFGLSGEDPEPRALFGISNEVLLTEHDPTADDDVADLVNRAVAEAQGPRIEYPSS